MLKSKFVFLLHLKWLQKGQIFLFFNLISNLTTLILISLSSYLLINSFILSDSKLIVKFQK